MRLLEPLREGAFLRLFLGTATTRIGDAMASLVLIWVTLQTHGPALLGSVLLVAAVPALIVAPIAGNLVARAGVARAVRLDNAARALAVVGLGLLIIDGQPSLPLLYLYAAIAGVTGPATEIAVDAATPEVVPDHNLNEANTLISISWDISDLIGPATAGAIMAWIGGPSVLLLVALCYTVMAVIVPAVPLTAPPTEQDGNPPTRPGPLTGFRLLFTTYRTSLYVTLISLFVLAASGAVEVLMPLLVSETLGAGPAELGVLMSVFGAVSLAATAILGPRVSRYRPAPTLAASLAIRGIGTALLGATRTVGTAASTGALSAGADGPLYPVLRTTQQRLVPAHHRPLVTGARGALNIAGFPLGNLIGGIAGSCLTAHTALFVLGALHLIPITALLLTKSLRNLPGLTERTSGQHDA